MHLRDEFVIGEGFKVEFVFRHRVVPAKRLSHAVQRARQNPRTSAWRAVPETAHYPAGWLLGQTQLSRPRVQFCGPTTVCEAERAWREKDAIVGAGVSP